MKTLRILAGLGLVSMSVACGGGSAPAGSEGPATGASPASASTASYKAVPHEKLTELLPTLSGWRQETQPNGDTDPSVNVSRVQVNYVQEGTGAGLSIEMMDVASNAAMIAPLRELLRVSGTRTSAGGTTQKVINVAGHVATEEWTPEANNGNVSVLVGDRFVVTVTGSSVADVGVIHKAVEAIDLKKVAALK